MLRMRREGREPRWIDRSRIFHLGPLPSQRFALLAGDDSGADIQARLICHDTPKRSLHQANLRLKP